MVDLACSVGLALGVVLLVLAYAGRVIAAGAANFDRVKRDRGSIFFGLSAMQMGYWGIAPIGRGLAALGVRANSITTSSLALGFASAAAIGAGHFGVAALLAVMSAVCDALDGMVARETRTASESGEVLDATVDRYVEFAFLGGLAMHEHDKPFWLAVALAAILGSFMVSYATAKAEAMGVTAPRGTMRRPERAAYLTMGAMLCPFADSWVRSGGPEWAREAPLLAAVSLVAVVANVSAVRRMTIIARSARASVFERPPLSPALPADVEPPSPRGQGDVRRAAHG